MWMRALCLSAGLAGFTAPALADVTDCKDDLVRATYNRFDSNQIDYRLASHVSKTAYTEIKNEAGANAVIYGFPVGASWDDFQQRASAAEKDFQTSLTENQATNIMWTGLDPSSSQVYENCLQTLVALSGGLHLLVKKATPTDVTVVVKWSPVGDDPGKIRATWSSDPINGHQLPTNFGQGETSVTIPRPKEETSLAINYKGHTDSIVLEPKAEPALVVHCEFPVDFKGLAPGNFVSFACRGLPDKSTIKAVYTGRVTIEKTGGCAQIIFSLALGDPSHTDASSIRAGEDWAPYDSSSFYRDYTVSTEPTALSGRVAIATLKNVETAVCQGEQKPLRNVSAYSSGGRMVIDVVSQ